MPEKVPSYIHKLPFLSFFKVGNLIFNTTMTTRKLQYQVLKSEKQLSNNITWNMMCMQGTFIPLSLIKTWATMNLPEQPYKYQERTTVSIISLLIFNCSGRSKKELPPPAPRSHLTCSWARAAPAASLPGFLGGKRGH